MEQLKRVLRLWPWLAAIVSGLLYRACFAPFQQAWLCWVALTPLLAAVWFSGKNSERRWGRDLLLGYVAGVTFFWSVFYWLYTVTVPGLVLVGLYMGIYMALWAWLCGVLRPGSGRALAEQPLTGLDAVTQRIAAKRAAASGLPATAAPEAVAVGATLRHSPWLSSWKNLRLAFFVSAAWVTVELLRSVVFTGWAWNSLGSALHAQWALIQIVELTGVPALSFLVAFTNVILVATVRRFVLESQVKKSRPHFDFTITMAAIVGVIGFGIRAVQLIQPSASLRVAALQPDIPREQKFNADFAAATFEKFTQLSQLALQSRPDLLLWPESSMPGPVLPGEPSYDFVMRFAAHAGADLLLGVIDLDEKDAYNAALLVSDAGKRVQLYRKMHLVPFGEYVPGRHTIPGIGAIVGAQVPEDFGIGIEHTVFQLTRPEVKVAPLICFEDTIGELTRQFVLRGANLLANVTNDGWFQRSAGSQQHLDNAVFRCVETRLPMVRSANTGVTCFINRFGRITDVLHDENGSQFTEGFKVADVAVPVNQPLTFYVRHGEWFADLCAVATALLLVTLLPRPSRWRRAFSLIVA
ncbi:MAG: apolipoprotein N-acyltransferase [Chthoniobacterales bacterium]